jgi:16S rRNA (cytidine1402-2'-O)-methyltransferase
MPGTLYIVATPIGNLKDITLRALETLRTVDLIACEDTRHTRKLLNHFNIQKPLLSLHEHNERERAGELIGRMAGGESIALVSDAGTPAVSDPGFDLVRAARTADIAVVPVPGPTALIAALVASGVECDAFFFCGFLPSRSAARRKRLQQLRDIPATLIFYEAPHRIARSLEDCKDVLGDRKAAVARELTKVHEEIVTGTLAELAARFEAGTAKGEFVVVIERGTEEVVVRTGSDLAGRVVELEAAGSDHKAALKQAAREFGLTRSQAYRRMIEESAQRNRS